MIGLRVLLGPDQPQNVPSRKRRSPSYYRRQERRKAARAAEQPVLIGGDSAEEASNTNDATATEEVKDKSSTDVLQIVNSEEESTLCEICDFKSVSKKGLDVHMRRKHGNIEQLDRNIEDKNSTTCELCDTKYCSEGGLENHIRRVHEEEDWKHAKRLRNPNWCSICDLSLTDIEAYERHMSYKHSKT